MPTPRDSIAIIGAGLSGATLAQLLQPARQALRIYEKGRGPGGRMSTRRTDRGSYNHGAAGFMAENVATLPKAVVEKLPPAVEAAHFPVAANGYVRTLLAEAPVQYGTRVSRLARESARWQLLGDEGQTLGHADSVLITAPSPQAAELVQDSHPNWADSLRQVEMTPRWVVLMKLSSSFLDKDPPRSNMSPWRRRPPITQHPGCVVFEAEADWSQIALEASAEDVISSCLASTGLDRSEIEDVQAHRWRYAICRRPLAADAFWDPTLRLGVAGDAFAGPRSPQGIVRAIHSATSLAELCGMTGPRP